MTRRPSRGDDPRRPFDPDRAHRQHPAAPGAHRRHGGPRSRRDLARRGPGAPGPSAPRHDRAARGHGLARDLGRRADEVELRDLSARGAGEPGTGRRRDPVRGRSHPTAAAAHVGTFPLRPLRGRLPGGRAALRARAGQAGRDRRLRVEPDLPAGRGGGLRTRRLPGRPRGRLRAGHPAIARSGRPPRADRLHRGAPVHQARSLRGPAAGLRGAQQPRPRALLRRRTRPDRRAHLSRRRPGLHPQRRRRLRRAASRAVRDQRRQRLRDARRRGGSRRACSS